MLKIFFGLKGVDAPTEEYVAREAKKALEPISRKLTGFQITSSISGKYDRQMSTENQVDSLINEARDNRHLVCFYSMFDGNSFFPLYT